VRFNHGGGSHQVILHGGLGNQLFQWSYGHRLALSGREVEFAFYKRPYGLEHTRTSLGEFLPNCEHGSFVEINLPKNPLGRILLNPVHRLNVFSKAMTGVHNSIKNPFLCGVPSLSSNKPVHYGYFQSFDSVLRVEDFLIDELWKVLENRERSQLESDLDGVEVIHIRQGDTLTPNNLKKVGVLSLDYYAQIPIKSAKQRIVLTDDVDGAKKVLSSLHIDGIFGPSELNVYQTLGVMARSTTLYAANSTLSWWGGFLAQSRGSNVYLPNPFFREFSPDPELSFAYPTFNLLNSHFMDLPTKD
jgi:hypothetical protein